MVVEREGGRNKEKERERGGRRNTGLYTMLALNHKVFESGRTDHNDKATATSVCTAKTCTKWFYHVALTDTASRPAGISQIHFYVFFLV